MAEILEIMSTMSPVVSGGQCKNVTTSLFIDNMTITKQPIATAQILYNLFVSHSQWCDITNI